MLDSESMWSSLRKFRVDVYIEALEYIHSDAGSNFRSLEFN